MDLIDKYKLTFYSSYKINYIIEKILCLFNIFNKPKIIFILGCQRSGTTIIQKIIGLDFRVKFLGEGDKPYFYDESSDNHHRLKPKKIVRNFLEKECLNYITIKPLYESHNVNSLIKENPDSKFIWVYRNYTDVIDSHISYYKQDPIKYIEPLFDQKRSWLNEIIPGDTANFIKKFDIKSISNHDAYALFWIVRNSLYFEIEKESNVLLVNYENLVASPGFEIKRIFDYIGLKYKHFYSKIIRSNAVSKDVDFTLDPIIEQKCNEIYIKLNQMNKS